MKLNKWYCFTCKKWHDKDQWCFLNDKHYGISDYNDFWEFIKEHKEELKKAIKLLEEGKHLRNSM